MGPLEEELDLTNAHLSSLETVPLAENLTSLDLTANRLRDLEPRLLALTGLRKLSLRQNVLTTAAALEQSAFAPVLQELVLHDNHLSQAPNLATMTSLTRLELSYNQIKSLSPLSVCRALSLRELFVSNNKISSLEGCRHFTQLTLLELGANRLAALDGIASFPDLRELWLGSNRIAGNPSLSCLMRLERLSIQSNRLCSMGGLCLAATMRELYLSHNNIQSIEGLDNLVQLRVLDLSNNALHSLDGIVHLQLLEDLWLNDNQLKDLHSVVQVLVKLKAHLSCVYLAGNPAADDDVSYRQLLPQLLPCLQQLDSDAVPGR
ncbi:hypothetical protein WJX74_004889 [Apatococcus lobatus]|uniref:Protein phosphatase 1 regulatory subunit 7 n=1 Tax=Apatococcus lobatus TaxID=904363 RepID=A0AAW1RPT3_9CHLO